MVINIYAPQNVKYIINSPVKLQNNLHNRYILNKFIDIHHYFKINTCVPISDISLMAIIIIIIVIFENFFLLCVCFNFNIVMLFKLRTTVSKMS